MRKLLALLLVMVGLLFAASWVIADDLPSVFPVGRLTNGMTIAQAKDIFGQSGELQLTEERSFTVPYGKLDQHLTILEFSQKGVPDTPLSLLFAEDQYMWSVAGKAKDGEDTLFPQLISEYERRNITSWGRGERCRRDKTLNYLGQSNVGPDRVLWAREYLDYRVMIADKVDRGEIQPSEAEYLFSKALNEVLAKSQANVSETSRALQNTLQQPQIIILPELLPFYQHGRSPHP
jgi:hypothetical protein